MQALLASYYGITNEEPAKREEEIDKADFVADSYVRRMLQREVRALDMTDSCEMLVQ